MHAVPVPAPLSPRRNDAPSAGLATSLLGRGLRLLRRVRESCSAPQEVLARCAGGNDVQVLLE